MKIEFHHDNITRTRDVRLPHGQLIKNVDCRL